MRDWAKHAGIHWRTAYKLIESGVLTPAQRHPYKLWFDDIERIKERRKQGALYRVVMMLRRRSYDAARTWVRRRQEKGLSEEEIIAELRSSRAGGQN